MRIPSAWFLSVPLSELSVAFGNSSSQVLCPCLQLQTCLLSPAIRYGPAYRRAPFLIGVRRGTDFGLSFLYFGIPRLLSTYGTGDLLAPLSGSRADPSRPGACHRICCDDRHSGSRGVAFCSIPRPFCLGNLAFYGCPLHRIHSYCFLGFRASLGGHLLVPQPVGRCFLCLASAAFIS